MKIAVVHEWLERYAGSERVLEQILDLYPDADLFAVVDFIPPDERGFIGNRPVRTSFIQGLPLARKHFRKYLGLMPLAVEQFDLRGYDVIISSSHAVAKGVITGPNQVHISYIHSPMRYAWDLQTQYLKQSGMEKGLGGLYARLLLHKLRMWDARTALGVDVFIANSRYIAARIRKVYRRDSIIVHPPVETDRFRPGCKKDDTYLVASRFEPYKRVDLIVQAFARMPDRNLVVVGSGSGERRIRELARGCGNITIRNPVPASELVAIMQSARAFVFAAEEDFGITLVEAQACGTPVIAFGAGGARDIIVDEDNFRPTGVMFDRQTPESVIEAIIRFEELESRFLVTACRENALRFAPAVFRERLRQVVEQAVVNSTNRRTVRVDRPNDMVRFAMPTTIPET